MSWLSSRLRRIGAATYGGVYGAVVRYLGSLRYPTLFVIAAVVFLLDLIVPDMIPFADEILLGILTIALGRMTGRKPTATRR
jgi:hypothetical protein